MEWIIREARGEDSEGAAEVVRTVFEEYAFTWEEAGYHADLYDLQTHYLDRGDRFWVAESVPDHRILATCGLDLFPLTLGAPGELVTVEDTVRIAATDCSLERLYVHPDARRQGIGGALFKRILQEARALGRRAMEIWSDKRFEAAHRLYQRYGAKVIGDRICDDPDEAPEWGLILPIGPTFQ